MNIIIIDTVYAVDVDNIDIIEPINNKDGGIEFLKITTKNNNCIKLNLGQYRELLNDYNKVLKECFYRKNK
jgi:hypothetical protein